MIAPYLETARVIHSKNGTFMIIDNNNIITVEDENYNYLLIELKSGQLVMTAKNVNYFRDVIGDVYKQVKI